MHTSEDKEVPLRAETDKVRDQWMQQITKATLDYVTTKKKMDREKEEQCKCSDSVGAVAHRLVTLISIHTSLPMFPTFHMKIWTLGIVYSL